MKVKMLETVQGVGISGELDGVKTSILEPGRVYAVDVALGVWLVENHKGEAVTAAHYGGQVEPELRHDDEIYAPDAVEEIPEIAEETLPEIEETPIMSTSAPAISKRKKGKK